MPIKVPDSDSGDGMAGYDYVFESDSKLGADIAITEWAGGLGIFLKVTNRHHRSNWEGVFISAADVPALFEAFLKVLDKQAKELEEDEE